MPRYPFPARKTRILERADIIEIVDWTPPTILTTDNELLLIARTQLDNLKRFCQTHDIPFTQQYDVWGDLLDPFLDTEVSLDTQKANLQRLKERGHLTDAEINAVRSKVEKKMDRVTAQSWEWQHYGLEDVLRAMKPKTFIGRRKWNEFYVEAMDIGIRGFR